jgi:hypothetical protein
LQRVGLVISGGHGAALQLAGPTSLLRRMDRASGVVERKVSPSSFPPSPVARVVSHFRLLAHAAHPTSSRQRRSVRWSTLEQIRLKKVHVRACLTDPLKGPTP